MLSDDNLVHTLEKCIESKHSGIGDIIAVKAVSICKT